jgi:hypothetical protein
MTRGAINMFILRSKSRANYEAYEPDSVSASSEEPDLELAPLEAWEEVESLEAVVAPKFGFKQPEVSIEDEIIDVLEENVEEVDVAEVVEEEPVLEEPAAEVPSLIT